MALVTPREKPLVLEDLVSRESFQTALQKAVDFMRLDHANSFDAGLTKRVRQLSELEGVIQHLTIRGTITKLIETARDSGVDNSRIARLGERPHKLRLVWDPEDHETTSQLHRKSDDYPLGLTPIPPGCLPTSVIGGLRTQHVVQLCAVQCSTA